MTDARPVAVVTGAAGGIGSAIARRLGRSHDVVLWDVGGPGLDAAVRAVEPAGATADVVDVTDRDAVLRGMARVEREHGRLDVLVNAAGMAQIIPFLELPEAGWDRMLDVNLKSVFLCTQAAVPIMAANGFGRVVSLASVGAYSGSVGHAHYAASKAGIIGFTKTLAREVGPLGITVNCVAPGAIETPMLGALTSEARERYSANPVGRLGTPDEIAAAVEYFVSPDAGYTTGWVLSVNGGVYT
ncbi:SDR family NAD(P)-dependent oxidoreductase [Agromyces aerolatus]|uniref:SDR family NAD(P)-dependent oxidoreductase n=1 Tax=Agromyces sp. LY-1074 TaxID=3074080 RepID=UPI002859D496|nr:MULTISPECIES: SDR family oxidoreductase [unclassified Agromyces]MDR5699766.1 SDR family oxidoreductase [Agromyces sp. LY-1074]MDR5706062.1 SDR family oxidoreductase [Agromyces sp. LY-1358]